MKSILHTLVDQVSKQRSVTNFLVGKVEALEQCSYQNQLVLSGIQTHLYGISQQLRDLGVYGGATAQDGSVNVAKGGYSRTNGIEYDFSDNSTSSSDPYCVKYRLTRKRPCYSTLHSNLTTESDESSSDCKEVRYSSSSSSCTPDCGKIDRRLHAMQNSFKPDYCSPHSPSPSLSSIGFSGDSESDRDDDDEDYTVKPKNGKAIREQNSTAAVNIPKGASVQLESSGYSSSLPKQLERTSADKTTVKSQKSVGSRKETSPPQDPPVAAPIVLRAAGSILPSAMINKSKLLSVETVLTKYSGHRLRYIGLKLATLAIFGPEVMKKCSPLGQSQHPALPQAELYMLKQILLDASPEYWTNPKKFEFLWKTEVLGYLGGKCCTLRMSKSRTKQKKESQKEQ